MSAAEKECLDDYLPLESNKVIYKLLDIYVDYRLIMLFNGGFKCRVEFKNILVDF